MDAAAPSSQPGMSNRTPLRIGNYALAVRDLERCAAFYRRAVGFETIAEEAGAVVLGVAGVALLRLEHRPNALPDDPTEAGLFHTAFILPSRRDLADWYRHAQAIGLPLTRTGDHDVNEALYYEDPEGNGCECYADRPPERWRWLDDGTVDIPTSPVDMDSLVHEASASSEPWTPPGGLRIGHINLRVGATSPSEAFFCEKIGLDHTGRRDIRERIITFMSSGRYHHHVATNDFTSHGAGQRDPNRAGLLWFTIEADNAATLAGTRAHIERAGLRVRDIADGFEVRDPWGTAVRFAPA